MIDYEILQEAIEYYRFLGYTQVDVPWIVGRKAYYATKPPNAPDLIIAPLEGYAVASGEQGFLEEMLKGVKFEKHFCITPCFRKEARYDYLYTYPYFLKLELISSSQGMGIMDMLTDALAFYRRFIPCYICPMDDGSFDIMSESGVELGSYGRRRVEDISWTYGTGLAEPRFSNVLKEWLLNR